jgi:hypothetical protein
VRQDKLSGKDARLWRKNLARFAISRETSIRTLKFPLDTPWLGEKNQDEFFKKAEQLYEIIEGTGRGSLTGLLCAVHLSGFRAFDNSTRTRLFRSFKGIDETPFKQAFEKKFGISAKNFLPQNIYNSLHSKPRNKEYNPRNVADKLYFLATGKTIGKDKSPCTFLVKFLEAFAEHVCSKFQGWDELREGIDEALKLFDDLGDEYGLKLPEIGHMGRQLVELKPDNSTIDFDPELPANISSLDGENALHMVVAQKLSLARREGRKENASTCKAEITTTNSNALSWLFGKGFEYWRRSDLETIMRDYQVPDEYRERLAELKAWFEKVPENPLFETGSAYGNFRKVVAGRIDSWVSNYVKRLSELEEALEACREGFNLPKPLLNDKFEKHLSGLGFTPEELNNLLESMPGRAKKTRNSLDRLLGRLQELPGEKDIKAIEDLSELLSTASGWLNNLKERLRKKYEDDKQLSQENFEQVDFEIPKWLKGLSRPNRIQGGRIDYQTELREGVDRFNHLSRVMEEHAEKLLDWAAAKGKLESPVQARIQIESERAKNSGRNIENVEELARRWIWQRLAGLTRTGSAELSSFVRREFEQAGLFKRKKDLNKLLTNKQGFIYKSPFSTSKHHPYQLNRDKLFNLDPAGVLENVLQGLESKSRSTSDPSILSDLLHLKRQRYALLLSGLPEQIPGDLARNNIFEMLDIPPSFEVQLNQEQVPRDLFLKVFNLYHSELRGLHNLIFRQEFIIRTKFNWYGWDKLFYAPKKDTGWSPPQHYFRSDKPIGIALHRLTKENLGPENIDPGKALEKLSSSKKQKRAPVPYSVYLKEAPHDWHINLPLKGAEDDMTGVECGKKGLRYKNCKGKFARLIGPSSYKGMLDEQLVDSRLELKEYTLLVERFFNQQISYETGEFHVEVTPGPVKMTLNVPIEEKIEKADPGEMQEEFPLAKTIIGIDLGEVGIGYAVFDAQDKTLLESGAIRIKSIRNLMRAVERYRHEKQPRQKFQQRFSNQLAQLRENATGDVLHHIDSLCAKYQGFPVLESSVANLASGGKQLKLIYDKVVHTYTFSDIDAHKKQRAMHWYGGDRWVHPFLEAINRETGEVKELSLFPGVAIHPARTSQTCSVCGRNPFLSVDRTKNKNLTVREGGGLSVCDGELKLFQPATEGLNKRYKTKLAKKYRRKKLKLPINQELPAGRISPDKAKDILRRQVRQAPDSTRSRDTKQSEHHCPYSDCGHTMHADENAAINIGRKWMAWKLGLKNMWDVKTDVA